MAVLAGWQANMSGQSGCLDWVRKQGTRTDFHRYLQCRDTDCFARLSANIVSLRKRRTELFNEIMNCTIVLETEETEEGRCKGLILSWLGRVLCSHWLRSSFVGSVSKVYSSLFGFLTYMLSRLVSAIEPKIERIISCSLASNYSVVSILSSFILIAPISLGDRHVCQPCYYWWEVVGRV